MITSTIAPALTYMFKDDDWFWKVSVGVLALLLIGLGVGYFLVIGYYVETARRCTKNDATLPEWNMLAKLWHTGRIVGAAMLCYSVLVLAGLAAVHQAHALTAGIAIVVTHALIQPFVVVSFLEHESFASCFAFRSFAATIGRNGMRAATIIGSGFGIFAVVLCFGWMALIVGWPFFIFWGMLAAAAFTASLAVPVEAGEAISQ